jgi:hypothetical protein
MSNLNLPEKLCFNTEWTVTIKSDNPIEPPITFEPPPLHAIFKDCNLEVNGMSYPINLENAQKVSDADINNNEYTKVPITIKQYPIESRISLFSSIDKSKLLDRLIVLQNKEDEAIKYYKSYVDMKKLCTDNYLAYILDKSFYNSLPKMGYNSFTYKKCNYCEKEIFSKDFDCITCDYKFLKRFGYI